MNYDKFAPLLGTWGEKLRPFIEGAEFDAIYAKLKSDAKEGRVICPSSSDTYKAFELCEWDKLKCVIIGMDPYPWVFEGVHVADGLAFSCSHTKKPQPSLFRLYEAIEDDCYKGLALPYEFSQDLSYLAKQGVLLLNSALTVEKDKVGSHADIWKPFMKYLLEEVLASQIAVPFILMGKQAQSFERWIPPFNITISVEHPANAARKQRKMIHENCFSKVNYYLKGGNGPEYQIEWLEKVKDK